MVLNLHREAHQGTALMKVIHEDAGAPICRLTEVNAKPTIVTLKVDGIPMAIVRAESGTSLVWRVRFSNMQFSSGAFANSQRAMDWLASGRPLLRSVVRQSYSASLKAALKTRPESKPAEFKPTDKRSGSKPEAVDRTDGTDTEVNGIERKAKTGPEWQVMDRKGRTDAELQAKEQKVRTGPEWQAIDWRGRTDAEIQAKEQKARTGPDWQVMDRKGGTDMELATTEPDTCLSVAPSALTRVIAAEIIALIELGKTSRQSITPASSKDIYSDGGVSARGAVPPRSPQHSKPRAGAETIENSHKQFTARRSSTTM